MVILLVRRLKDNQKRLTPANGISLNFIHASKVLPDSNNFLHVKFAEQKCYRHDEQQDAC